MEELTLDDWNGIHFVHARAAWLLAKAALPALKESRGAMVATASINATLGNGINTISNDSSALGNAGASLFNDAASTASSAASSFADASASGFENATL